MQDGNNARDLLRASATDVDAVRQYLQAIDADELNSLLDGIAPRGAKGKQKAKKKSEYLVQDDWLPLVHLLVHCDTTRLRAATRIIQLLRRGAPSELESMQLLTEINLGYASALDELAEHRKQSRAQLAVRRRKLMEEIDVVLEIVFSFLSDVIGEKRPVNAKVLPQLLGLVPYFLGMTSELSSANRNSAEGDEPVISENLAKLMDLPWNAQTVPSLLDVLVDDPSLMSHESWRRLQENVERMVMTSPEMPSETVNPIIRESIFVANVTGDHKWIGIARYLLRQLPLHLRQEAEFNLQMSFQQSQRIVSLVCKSIRCSQFVEGDDVVMLDLTGPAEESSCDNVNHTLDWRDLILLLHSLQASKPILHHRTSSSRVATEASLFTDIEQLAWKVVEKDLQDFASTLASGSSTANRSMEKHVNERVEELLNFGGKQIHAREWKALLLMDLAFFWIEQTPSSIDRSDQEGPIKPALAQLVLQAIFQATPETRSELLSCVFERSQRPAQRKIAEETLEQLFNSQKGKLFPHLNAIQDWLSLQFRSQFDSARESFLIASRLATTYKDLYNFLMVFLRKLLSAGNRSHQEFAVDMWCLWLDHRLAFNEQQEEEIVSALKSSVAVCHEIQAWSFGRLEQVFHPGDTRQERCAVSMRKNSWEELHRFLSQEVGRFIRPTTNLKAGSTGYGDGDSEDSEDEDAGQHQRLSRFRFCSFVSFYRQNPSLDGAAAVGLVFQKVLSCLLAFERAALRSKTSSDGLPIEACSTNDGEVKRWVVDLVSNWKFFFHWICQGANDTLGQSARSKALDKNVMWLLLARVYIGCALCNITIEMLMWRRTLESPERSIQHGSREDDVGLSLWSLMEVEFCLHRMVRKLAAQCSNQTETSLSKEHLSAASYGLYRVLQPEMLSVLTSIKNTVQNSDSEGEPSQYGHSEAGVSFDAVLFALDTCYCALGDEDRHAAYFPQNSVADGLDDCVPVLETLLHMYQNVRDRVLSSAKLSVTEKSMQRGQSVDDSGDESDENTAATVGVRFSVYADSIVAKFPRSVRYLLAPAKSAKAVVLLDSTAGEDILEHICAAIGRTVAKMVKVTNAHKTQEQLRRILRNALRAEQGQSEPSHCDDSSNGFAGLACYFLVDVKQSVQFDGITRLGVSCAALSKRLSDVGAEMMDGELEASEWHTLSSVAYDVICDNVVYNAHLLRLLLKICLPMHFALKIKTFVTMESKIEGFIQACGLDVAVDPIVPVKTGKNRQKPTRRQRGNQSRSPHWTRRKRLRQGFDARSSYGLHIDSDSDSSDHSASSSQSRASSLEQADSDVDSDAIAGTHRSLTNRTRTPHLNSQVSQSAAILAVFVVLEQSLSTLLKAIAPKKSSAEPASFPPHEEIRGYVRIHDLVNQAISNTRDFSWGTRKALLKVLHMIELSLRIGKAGGALRRAGDCEAGPSPDTTLHLFEASVLLTLRSRTWIDSIKEASQDSGTKTRISSTSLKMDIFLLQVPGTVKIWLKESTLDDVSRSRLKTLVASVKEKIAPMDQTKRRGKAKAKQRLFGVVPVVKKRRRRLRSRHPIIDAFLNEEDGADAFADLEDFIE